MFPEETLRPFTMKKQITATPVDGDAPPKEINSSFEINKSEFAVHIENHGTLDDFVNFEGLIRKIEELL